MEPTPDREAGFTLLEVLVAFVILALVVTACLQVYARSGEAEARARWSDRANTLLRDRLASFETLGLQPGRTQQGETADGLRWTISAELADSGADNAANDHSAILIVAQVVDPTGAAFRAVTARWRGEVAEESLE